MIGKRAAESGEVVDAEPIVHQLVDEGLIDDIRYIRNQIRLHTGPQNIKGPRELKRKLSFKGGISDDIINEWIDENADTWKELARVECQKTLSISGLSNELQQVIPEKTYQKIRQKLFRKGFTGCQIDSAMEGLSYQKDRKIAAGSYDVQKIIDKQKSIGKGPAAIRYLLKQKGFDASSIEEHLDFEDKSWVDIAKTVVEKKFGKSVSKSKSEKGKRIKYLLGKGFLVDHAKEALEEF